MKKINLVLIAASIIALISCSRNNSEIIDEEASLDMKTKDNDTINGGKNNIKTIPWIEVTDSIVASEIPKAATKTDSIPNDSIPNDSILN